MCLDQLNGKTLDMWDCKTGATAANQQFAYNNTLSGIVVGDSTATRQCLTATASGGGGAEATLFGKVAFLSNMDDFAGAAVTYAGNSYYLPNHTVAIVRPLPDPMDINRVYRRAVLADARNADILRQRETFALEYDRYGRGDAVLPCIICTGGQKCETCVMKDRFGDELKDLPLGAAGRTLTLDEMATMLLDAPKPPLNFTLQNSKIPFKR